MKRHVEWRKPAIKAYNDDPEHKFPPMTDKEFLKQLHEIVPPNQPIVTAKQATAIYRLMSILECYKPGQHGFIPQYKSESVIRSQVHNGTLQKLTSDEIKAYSSEKIRPSNLFWLQDILEKPLGRWPAPTRVEFQKKHRRGRPTKAESKLIQYERRRKQKEERQRAEQREIIKEKNRLSRSKNTFTEPSAG